VNLFQEDREGTRAAPVQGKPVPGARGGRCPRRQL